MKVLIASGSLPEVEKTIQILTKQYLSYLLPKINNLVFTTLLSRAMVSFNKYISLAMLQIESKLLN